MSSKSIFAGVDVGSSRTKVVIIDENKEVIGTGMEKSGIDFSQTAEDCLTAALEMAGASKKDMVGAMSTGYGRNNVEFSQGTKTEISCHALGCYHFFPMAIDVIDIGGQDNKIIRLDAGGGRTGFKMNRKCAAGTGAFLEEMSLRLNIPIEKMNDHAAEAVDMIKLGSYCTVFSGTEVLQYIRQGKKAPEIIKGLFYSVIKRVLEMGGLGPKVVMTGGVVANNPYLAKMTEEILGREVLVTPYPQFTGAIGAALFALKARGSERRS